MSRTPVAVELSPMTMRSCAVLACMLFFLAAGCASTKHIPESAKDLPPTQLAMLTWKDNYKGKCDSEQYECSLHQIDGVYLGELGNWHYNAAVKGEVYVRAGTHAITYGLTTKSVLKRTGDSGSGGWSFEATQLVRDVKYPTIRQDFEAQRTYQWDECERRFIEVDSSGGPD